MAQISTPRPSWKIAALLPVIVGLAACGSGDGQSAAPTSSSSTRSATSAASSAASSGTSSAAPTHHLCLTGGRALPGDHGTNAAIAGRGSTAVVFVNMAGGSACDWSAYAETLVKGGQSVVAYDYASPDGPLADRQRELRGVVAGAKAQGANRIVVIGGSRGGCLGLIEAASSSDVDAVAVLSCAKVWNRDDPTPLTPYLSKVRQPVLSVVAAQDPDVPVAEVRADAASLPNAKVIVVAGGEHGVPLLSQPAVATQLTALIAGT